MKRILTFGAMQEIGAAAFLNPLQDLIVGAQKADNANDLTLLANGADIFTWQYKAGIASGAAPVKIASTATISWLDRIVFGLYQPLAASADGLGGANEYNFSNVKPELFMGYTGTGGKTAGGADPSAGNPPVLGAGKYRIQCDAANKVLLYVLASSGELYLYNDSAGTIYPALVLFALGDTGLH